jgi:hypothetical protein
LFQKFQSAATGANGDLKRFRELLEAEDSIKVFEHVRESLAENPKGVKAWRITEHADWYIRDTKI